MTLRLSLAGSLLCLLFSGAVAFSPAVTVATQKAAASFLAARSRGLKSTKLGAARAFSEDAPAAHGRALRSRNTRTPAASTTARASQSVCEWNSTVAECKLSSAGTVEYLNSLHSDYASFVAQFPACEAAETKSACRKAGNCVWDSVEKKCFFVDVLTGQEDSPCLKAAPAAISTISYTSTCAAVERKAKCSKEPACTWDHDEGVCDADLLLLLYGFHTDEFSSEIEKLSETWALEIFKDYSFFESPEFKWSDLLEWKGPDEACTADASPEVCDFLREGFIPLLPNTYYCVFKYDDPSQQDDCDSDPLCTVDESDGSCEVDPAIRTTHALRSTLDQIDSKMDRGFLKDVLDCFETPKKKCKGKCYWSDVDDECTASNTALFQKVAAADTSAEDTLCRFIQAAADSDCLDIEDAEECEALDNCTWRTLTEGCEPSAEYFTKGAATSVEGDTSFIDLQDQCAKQKKKTNCVAVAI